MPIHPSGIVKRLEGLDVASLRASWLDVFGVPAPAHAKRDLLTRCLAYALQEREYGGLSKSLLKDLCADPNDSSNASAQSTGEGTRLVRGWGGATHEVTVLAQGFAYRGTTYRSLSEIARTITSLNPPK